MVDVRLSQLATAPSPAQDTDNLMISRAGVSYKISRKELIKNFLANLADVSIVAPADGDVLTYDSTNGMFSPQKPQTGGLTEVHWDQLLDKPSAYPPSTHSHAYSSLTSIPATFTPSAHQHIWSDLSNPPATYTPSVHAHAWADLTSGVPATFPPSTHQHAWNDLTSDVPAAFPPSAHRHPWTELDSIPATFPPSAHTHLWTDLTDKPLSFPPSIHNHDDRYYTEQELYTSGSGAQVHWNNITGAPSFEGGGDMLMAVYDMDHDGIVDAAASVPWEGISSIPGSFPPDAHTHDWADLTSGVPTAFPPSAHQHPGSDITSSVPNADAVPWTGVSGKPTTFTPSTHQHAWADLTSGVPTTFAPSTHTHTNFVYDEDSDRFDRWREYSVHHSLQLFVRNLNGHAQWAGAVLDHRLHPNSGQSVHDGSGTLCG